MTRVRCITMQRDETQLLGAWLRYHGTLFGFENLVVFDNGSSERSVVQALAQAERVGVDVRWTHRSRRDFEQRGSHLFNLMRGWEEAEAAYDFAVPLDCDEFLVTWTRTGLDCRTAAIEAELERRRGEARALAIPDALFNVPGRPGWFVVEDQRKCLLPAHTAGGIDGAWRFAISSRADGVCDTALATLHFRNKPLRELRARARRRFEGGGGVPAHDAPGGHLAAVVALDEQSFLHRFDDRLMIGFPAFGATLAALGVESRLLGAPPPAGRRVPHEQVAFMRPAGGAAPVWFDGNAYLAKNPDVAGAQWPAALHYVRHGGRERRDAPGEAFVE